MTIQINYKKNNKKNRFTNLVLFVDEKFNISDLKSHISKTDYNFIYDILKTSDTKKNFLSFNIDSKKQIILASIEKNLTSTAAESLGAKFVFVESEENLETEGGYAKEVTEDYKKKQEELMKQTVKNQDVINTSGEENHPIIYKTGNKSDFIKGILFKVYKEEIILSDKYEACNYKRINLKFQSGKSGWVYVEK